jgi:hypothetical protein
MKQRAIAQQYPWDGCASGQFLKHVPEMKMERGFPCPGQSQMVRFSVSSHPSVKFRQNLGDRHILGTNEGLCGGDANLAVGAIKRTDFEWNQIQTKRTAQPPGADWAEQVSIPFVHHSGEMASTGHSPAQSPQSTHLSASITYCLSPSAMASCGQTGAQLPHFVHLSEIIYDMIFSS